MGYLMIASMDCTQNTSNPSLLGMWFWDPSEPEATRVLAMCTHNADKSVSSMRYAAHDLLKSVSGLFDASGTRQAKFEYTPYGETLTAEGAWASSMPFRYSCEYRDEDLGLIYYNYRHYNPQDGRWISRDPIGEISGENVYHFVHNSVSGMIDMMGLDSWNLDKDSCILTYKVKIQVRFKDETKRWMADSERDYMSGLKTSIENTFNNNSYKFAPEVQNEDQCPCCNGFTPKVELEVVKEPSRFSGDYDWFIKAHADDAGNRRASSTVGFNNGLFIGGRGVLYGDSHLNDISQIVQYKDGHREAIRGGRIPAAHEFGHGLGLNHPGKGINGNKANSLPEYTHQGKDTHGNEVDGEKDLMGIGSGLRPFYFDKWKQYLNRTYQDCNYK